MSLLPNIANRNSPSTENIFGGKKVNRIRVNKGHESKGMEEILGSAINKEYDKVQLKKNTDNNIFLERKRTDEKQINRDGTKRISQDLSYQEIDDEMTENNERMNKYLLEQFNYLEKQVQSEIKKSRLMFETERDTRIRLENALKYTEEQVKGLEEKMYREERTKLSLKEKLESQEQNQREILDFIRNIQSQENSELTQMRQIIHSKGNDDASLLSKEREKSKALFTEVVRLGEIQERNTEMLNNITATMETKIMSLEDKLMSKEKALSSVMQKGELGFMSLNDWNEKMEKRIQHAETNLMILGREQLKERDEFNRLESHNQRITEDIRTLLYSLQNDYSTRLESKVSELVTRIIMEHEDRIRSHEDFKSTIETKEKLNGEKLNYEREEMRDRYKAMDSLVRNEFMRKDEAIRSLQGMLENYVRSLQSSLKQEESNRNQNESIIREDFLRFQEIMRKEYDMFSGQQSSLNEKITEMIKMEVETRLTSDIDLKNLANTLASDLISEIKKLKDVQENQRVKFTKSVNDLTQDIADKACNISHYVDDEVKKVMEYSSSKYEKLKNLLTKLAEQFKKHLLNFEGYKTDSKREFNELQVNVEENKKELKYNFEDLKKKIDLNFETERESLTALIDSKNQVLEDRCSKLQDELEHDVGILKESLETNKNLIISKMDMLDEAYKKHFGRLNSYYEEIISTLGQFKESLVKFEETTFHNFSNLQAEVYTVSATISTEIMGERALRNSQMEEMVEHLKDLNNEIVRNMFKVQKQADTNRHTIDSLEIKTNKKFQTFEEKAAELSTEISLLDSNLNEFKEKNKQDLNHIAAETILNKTKEGAEISRLNENFGRISNLLLKDKQISKINSETIKSRIEEIQLKVQEISSNIVKNVDQVYDEKLQNWITKFKRENQLIWEESVKIAEHGLKSFGKFPHNSENKENVSSNHSNKINQIVWFEDTYDEPKVLK